MLADASSEEKRHFPRVHKSWFVHYARVGATSNAGWDAGSVKDLSAGGASFVTEEVLSVNTRLRMKFNLPVPALRLVYGTIIRCREVRPRQYECGVVFDPLSPAETAVVQRYVTKLLKLK